MTVEIKQKAARLLATRSRLIGDEKWLPVIYIVGNHHFWFLNAARREAYCTKRPIEQLTIEEAYPIHYGKELPEWIKKNVVREFDQRGETYGDFLFCDNGLVKWNNINLKIA